LELKAEAYNSIKWGVLNVALFFFAVRVQHKGCGKCNPINMNPSMSKYLHSELIKE
jgi:hypothetical protein